MRGGEAVAVSLALVGRAGAGKRHDRRVVHRGDGGGEALGGALVDAAVGRAAVVGELEGDGGAAVGVGRRGVGQGPGRAHRGPGREGPGGAGGGERGGG